MSRQPSNPTDLHSQWEDFKQGKSSKPPGTLTVGFGTYRSRKGGVLRMIVNSGDGVTLQEFHDGSVAGRCSQFVHCGEMQQEAFSREDPLVNWNKKMIVSKGDSKPAVYTRNSSTGEATTAGGNTGDGTAIWEEYTVENANRTASNNEPTFVSQTRDFLSEVQNLHFNDHEEVGIGHHLGDLVRALHEEECPMWGSSQGKDTPEPTVVSCSFTMAPPA
ncbi:uncharacterized protein I303_100540 [Kwoniella dejecticola CBS 10117]|uniref:Uncharacterized protein n=1 Tax=Kwoniella dejecticola CBS 10117 TaxID=1296121 RepID=A0A1A6AF97_9TREE|nr:uncharacterized protein I303_00541 [Kwoniella dejecticola CBS 10117]OBR88724.1 hypothetical protein I303_00541 [Kwoniella dejecticola CBS 10117]